MSTVELSPVFWPGSANASAFQLIRSVEAKDRRLDERTRRLHTAVVTVILLNVLDVLLTQWVLRTHPGAREGNVLLAGIVTTQWIWLPKFGLPTLLGIGVLRRPLTLPREIGVYLVWGVYWAIVVWNLRNLLV